MQLQISAILILIIIFIGLPCDIMGHLEIADKETEHGISTADTVITGEVESNIYKVGGNILVQPDAILSGDIMLVAGKIDVCGKVYGDVLNVSGDTKVSGEIVGNVTTFLGNLYLSSTAIIHGDAKTFVGTLYKEEGARILGKSEMFASKQKKSIQEKEIDWYFNFNYNRVGGAGIWIGPQFHDPDMVLPSFYAKTGYSFVDKLWKYDLGFEHRVMKFGDLGFGAKIYKLTDSADNWIIDEGENSLAALLIKEDFKDYYGREGFLSFISQSIGYYHRIKLSYCYERYWSMKKNTNWSLFGGKKQFRDNPTVQDGENRCIILNYSFDTRDDDKNPTTGWYNTIDIEYAGPLFNLESDFEYIKYLLTLRRYLQFSPYHSLNIRLMLGTATNILPYQKEFAIGGIGTLQGYDYKEFFGDRMILTNIEYLVPLPHKAQGIIFTDTGNSWYGKKLLEYEPLYTDVGIGFQNLDSGLRINFAKRLDDLEKPIKITLRLHRLF